MAETIQIGDIFIAVTRKDIKNVHLSVLSLPKTSSGLWS